MDTKACNLSENEIKQLIMWHGYNLNDEGKVEPVDGDMFERIERINYLNKRLKTFKEPEKTEGVAIVEQQTKPDAQVTGNPPAAWPTNG